MKTLEILRHFEAFALQPIKDSVHLFLGLTGLLHGHRKLVGIRLQQLQERRVRGRDCVRVS